MDQIGKGLSDLAAQWSRTNDLLEDAIPTWVMLIQQIGELMAKMEEKLEKLEG